MVVKFVCMVTSSFKIKFASLHFTVIHMFVLTSMQNVFYIICVNILHFCVLLKAMCSLEQPSAARIFPKEMYCSLSHYVFC